MPNVSAEQVTRVERAVTFIDEHLCDHLDLDLLAAIACFSKFHFHRLFREVTGSSPREYVLRRRLERAYHILSNDSTLSVSEVADVLGFSSASNFARSFKECYACSPRAVQARSSALGGASEGGRSFILVDPARVRLETLQPFRILFIRRQGHPSPAVVEPFFLTLRAECSQRGWAMPGAREVVIGRSVPGLGQRDKHLFDIGVEVPFVPSSNARDKIQTIPGGTYARYDYCGEPSGIVECWDELYCLWLKRSGLSVGKGFGLTVRPSADRESSRPPVYQLLQPVRSRRRW